MGLILLLLSNTLWGQKYNQSASFKEREFTTRNLDIVNALVRVQNKSSKQCKLLVELKSNLQLLGKDSVHIIVDANDSLFLPVKLYTPQFAIAGSSQLVEVVLKTEDNRILSRDTAIIKIEKYKFACLSVNETNILAQKSKDSTIVIPIYLSNKGNSSEHITVIARIPILNDNALKSIASLTLPPFSDTTIYLRQKNTNAFHQNNVAQITITGLYSNGLPFSSSVINVQSAQSKRSFTQEYRVQQNRISGQTGHFDLSGHFLFSGNEYYEITSQNRIILPNNAILSYNVNATAWKNTNNKPLLRNTFLDYSTSRYGISAGNLTRNFDLNINGRGLAYHINDSSKKNTFEIGYVQNASNLLGDFTSSKEAGNAYWASYSGMFKDKILNSALLHYKVPYSNTDITLLNSTFNVLSNEKRKGTLTTVLGLGNANASGNLKESKQGFALGMNYQRKMGQYNIFSSNYYSTPYYPGQSSGYISFNERIAKQIKSKQTLWFSFIYNKSHPGTLPGSPPNNWLLNNMEANLGTSFSITDNTNVNFSTKFFKQENNYLGLISGNSVGPSVLEGASLLFSGNIMMPLSQFQLLFNFEGGLYKSSNQDNIMKFHSKAILNLNYKFFSLNSSIQQGYFSTYEMLNPNTTANNKSMYVFYSLSPTLNQYLWKGRCKTSIGVSLNGNSGLGFSTMVNLGLVFQLNRSTRAYSNFNTNRFSPRSFQSNDLSIGVSQVLPQLNFSNPYKTKNDLSVFLFYDNNGDGIFNNGDSVAQNQILMINNEMLRTNSRGKVYYNNLPDSNYVLKVPTSGNWYAPERRIQLNQSTEITIPLQKTGQLFGSLSFSSNQYSYETDNNLSGIKILAQDKLGKMYETKTDDKGNFIFYLPDGIYTIFIKKENLKPEVECIDNKKILEVNQKKAANISFNISAKHRKIETKKFISVSVDK